MSKSRRSDVARFARIFGALSNPHRLRIFLRLVSCCTPGRVCSTTNEKLGACVGDLGRGMKIAPSTVSHHLKELRAAGLIHMEREGQRVECWIEPEILRDLSGFFEERQVA
jgi:ArsR family transcriptional regulator